MPNANSVFINADMRGGTRRISLWPYGDPAAGSLKEVHDMVKRAAHAVSLYDNQRGGIDNDKRLSDAAKREDTKKAALGQLSRLVTAQKNLHREAADLNDRRSALLEVKPYAHGDFATVAIDLALAQHLRGMNEAGRIQASNADPRVADVLLRLPSTLTGINEGMKSRLLADAANQKNPEEAKELEALSEALRYANEGLANAAQMIARDAGLDRAQFAPYAHIGTGAESTHEPAADTDDSNKETAE